jgi:hypothetical protein
MLIEELFARGTMTMGPSRSDPQRQVGVFPNELLSRLAAARAAELEKFRWLLGDWNYENRVPATRLSPAYIDAGTCRFSLCENNAWICSGPLQGPERRNLTFEPLSRQWMYVLTQGSFGILRSSAGWDASGIVFTGMMTMAGVNCEWRMTWVKEADDAFHFINEELGAGGAWQYVDEWRFRRA